MNPHMLYIKKYVVINKLLNEGARSEVLKLQALILQEHIDKTRLFYSGVLVTTLKFVH